VEPEFNLFVGARVDLESQFFRKTGAGVQFHEYISAFVG